MVVEQVCSLPQKRFFKRRSSNALAYCDFTTTLQLLFNDLYRYFDAVPSMFRNINSEILVSLDKRDQKEYRFSIKKI